jgi:hypothetical protein
MRTLVTVAAIVVALVAWELFCARQQCPNCRSRDASPRVGDRQEHIGWTCDQCGKEF